MLCIHLEWWYDYILWSIFHYTYHKQHTVFYFAPCCGEAVSEGKKKKKRIRCQSSAPAARGSAWRDEQCQWKMMEPLTRGMGLHVYFKHQIFFYTFSKTLGQRFYIFSSPSPRFIISLLSFKQSSCFSDSLRIMFTCDYIVTHAYHISQFIFYLSKSCLPLVS